MINTAFPAWSTTQEKLLIQQRLADMYPDLIIMLSGTNDVHWALHVRDVRWHYSVGDQNYVTLLNETYRSSGHPEWVVPLPFSSGPVNCDLVGRTTVRNVEEAAFAADRANAGLVFALQPNIVSTAKGLSEHEQKVRKGQDAATWDSCYQRMREALGRIRTKHYRFLDLSRSFGDLGRDTELFVDAYHFADLGHRLVAQALADQIDWNTIVPNRAVAAEGDPLTIVRLERSERAAQALVNAATKGASALRIVPSRINKNLLVVFDRSILPTLVTDDSIVVSVPASLNETKGKHSVHIVDGMTGESSPSVVFESR